MKRRGMVLAAVLALISVPVVLVIVEAVSFHVQNRSNGFMLSSGQKREYLLHVPESYNRTRPTPLVISMHGASLWGAAQRDISQWNKVADANGFIVVYPSGRQGVGPRAWRVNDPALRDVKFIAALIDTLKATYNIDATRIYADGLSNGGGMAFVLSCTLSDRIAAVGLVGAAHLTSWRWCTDQRAVPMIAMHGTADSAAPYLGGKSWVAGRPLPSIPAWTASWARRNQCDAKPVESVVAADVTRIAYTHCRDDASVVLFRIEGGGHTWPGGGAMPEWFAGRTSNSIDASRQMWAFFRAHPLTRLRDTTLLSPG